MREPGRRGGRWPGAGEEQGCGSLGGGAGAGLRSAQVWGAEPGPAGEGRDGTASGTCSRHLLSRAFTCHVPSLGHVPAAPHFPEGVLSLSPRSR